MNAESPRVSVIIAARPDQARIEALAAAQHLDYPPDRREIIVARGTQPSVQRNAAIKIARGDWLYFLDDDSIPQPDNLRRALKFTGDARVLMVGGPNLCPSDATLLERVFAVVLGSWLAFGPSRARYARVGEARSTSEKELILCNLMARRDAIAARGGFNEALYPNEENALMDELQQRGGTLIYDPQFVAYRRPRRSLGAFARMLQTYGRGRAEQFRVRPTIGSALNFVPPLFCAYLLGLLALAAVAPASPSARWAAMPLAAYAFALVMQTAVSAASGGGWRALGALPLLVASHLFYGAGFWRGLFTPLRSGTPRKPVQVTLEVVEGFGAQAGEGPRGPATPEHRAE